MKLNAVNESKDKICVALDFVLALQRLDWFCICIALDWTECKEHICAAAAVKESHRILM